ncbi:Udp-galactose transporter [Rasamsonia emersonii CBS 393.64]|uniref:Udp-galactose transporter n=1 Tax=Rasamsonia emersonii (strain ATCC 16479 / CBS 393.64 / IMI 116815) TaxID=1408163 RepID=A0A0F4YYZ6_RASE3|nr:Udp-galactose transporter [Rasamsonia emersonii CBS 393.64]KKA23061.1 Udp-galactose transporter [Rasamsonia emersonii CBS 393.64]
MGEGPQSSSSWTGIPLRHISFVLLTIQYTAFVLLLHYSRVMPAVGGKRYLTSTAVFLNEVIKLAISLTMALYEVSQRAPPSMPATSLFFSLSSAVFSGDSWKLAIPASLYTLANSLQYIALSNLEAATFQVTYQLKLVSTTLFSLFLLRRSISPRKWAILLLLVAGIALVQLPDSPSDPISIRDKRAHLNFPRSLEEWKRMEGAAAANLQKRSATYEGIQEDLLLEHPTLNGAVGLLATIGACVASGFATVYFEKVLKDSTTPTSLWIRNVQLAIYSIFPALFIGVIFFDGEKIANQGFFDGYNWAVWSTITIQALGGIAAAFSITYADRIAKNLATGVSIILSTLASVWLFDLQLTANFAIGAAVVLAATYLYGNQASGPVSSKGHATRPPPIRIENYEKGGDAETEPTVSSPPNDFSIKLPTTPLSGGAGLSTSRPTSPNHHSRAGSSRNANGGYFTKNPQE